MLQVQASMMYHSRMERTERSRIVALKERFLNIIVEGEK